jgi:preprotein translocase subunit SecD
VGEGFILVEMAGVDLASATRLVGTPGRFEMRIRTGANQTAPVLDSAHISSAFVEEVDPVRGVWGVALRLRPRGAELFREAALSFGALDNPEARPVVMLLDGETIYEAPIGDDLARSLRAGPQDRAVAVTGSGDEGRARAKELQAHLDAGVLPVSVSIAGSGQVPPTLGRQFTGLVFTALALGLAAVAALVLLRYRSVRVAAPLVAVSSSEVLILLGFAASIGWSLDLPSLAGIILVVGTGVDHLLVITDDAMRGGELKYIETLRARVKGGLGTIATAAATTAAAMAPLAFFGFGALSGFALVTIIGLILGVGVARPAYAHILTAIISRKPEIANRLAGA